MKSDADIDAADLTVSSRDSLSEKIYNRLRVALMTGAYESGARLNIRGLAASYETSPTPVREAIMQLVREGSRTEARTSTACASTHDSAIH